VVNERGMRVARRSDVGVQGVHSAIEVHFRQPQADEPRVPRVERIPPAPRAAMPDVVATAVGRVDDVRLDRGGEALEPERVRGTWAARRELRSAGPRGFPLGVPENRRRIEGREAFLHGGALPRTQQRVQRAFPVRRQRDGAQEDVGVVPVGITVAKDSARVVMNVVSHERVQFGRQELPHLAAAGLPGQPVRTGHVLVLEREGAAVRCEADLRPVGRPRLDEADPAGILRVDEDEAVQFQPRAALPDEGQALFAGGQAAQRQMPHREVVGRRQIDNSRPVAFHTHSCGPLAARPVAQHQYGMTHARTQGDPVLCGVARALTEPAAQPAPAHEAVVADLTSQQAVWHERIGGVPRAQAQVLVVQRVDPSGAFRQFGPRGPQGLLAVRDEGGIMERGYIVQHQGLRRIGSVHAAAADEA